MKAEELVTFGVCVWFVMDVVGCMGAGVDVMDGMHVGQSQGGWSHVGRCRSTSGVRDNTPMTSWAPGEDSGSLTMQPVGYILWCSTNAQQTSHYVPNHTFVVLKITSYCTGSIKSYVVGFDKLRHSDNSI